VVVGPESALYMMDHHHAVRALWEANVDEVHKELRYQVIEDLSHMTLDEFWSKMKRNHCTYLYKNGIGPLPYTELPQHISDLSDDPYRSLAWVARCKKGFKSTSIPFAEFIWADFLRQEIQKELDNTEVYDILEEALQMCHSEKANYLPGYRPARGRHVGEEAV